jgi:hypothetical protein
MAHAAVIASPAAAGTYVIHVGGGLSRRGRTAAWILALALLLVGASALYSAAAPLLTGAVVSPPGSTHATSVTTGEPPAASDAIDGTGGSTVSGATTTRRRTADDPIIDDAGDTRLTGALRAEWDGPTTQMDWQAKRRETVVASCVGERISSPGDDTRRTLKLANAGPGAALLTVGVRVSELLPESANNPDLAQGIELFWDAAGIQGSRSFADLLADQQDGTPILAQMTVPQEETVKVTVGFRMNIDQTEYRMLAAASTELSFDVVAQMREATAAAGVVPAGMPRTGVTVIGAVALAVGLLVVGMLLLSGALLRRRCGDCGKPVRHGDPFLEHHLGAGRRHLQCAACGGMPSGIPGVPGVPSGASAAPRRVL